MIDKINKLISELTKYGIRQKEIMALPFSILNWSNGSENWYLTHFDHTDKMRIGSSLTLDANQLVVPFKFSEVQKIIEQLHVHPLYSNSFEYGERLRKKLVKKGILPE